MGGMVRPVRALAVKGTSSPRQAHERAGDGVSPAGRMSGAKITPRATGGGGATPRAAVEPGWNAPIARRAGRSLVLRETHPARDARSRVGTRLPVAPADLASVRERGAATS